MADARAEALLAANGWALFREVLAAGGAARAVQDGYVAAMAAPGARARTRGGWGRRGRGLGGGQGRGGRAGVRDAPGAASDGKHARPRAPPRRRRAGGRARLVPRQPPPARDRGDCGAGALRAHHAGHPRAGGVPGERRRADAGAGTAARRCWGRARRRAWRGGRRPRPPPPPPLPCPPAARRATPRRPRRWRRARALWRRRARGAWWTCRAAATGRSETRAASLAHCWWHSWPRGGRAAAAAVRRTRVCSGAAPTPCPRSLPLLARSSAAPRGGKSEELRGITHQGGVPSRRYRLFKARGQGATHRRCRRRTLVAAAAGGGPRVAGRGRGPSRRERRARPHAIRGPPCPLVAPFAAAPSIKSSSNSSPAPPVRPHPRRIPVPLCTLSARCPHAPSPPLCWRIAVIPPTAATPPTGTTSLGRSWSCCARALAPTAPRIPRSTVRAVLVQW